MEERVWDITAREDLEKAVQEILNRCESGAGATVLALHGDLGAGKTAFVQALAKLLGIKDTVTSPTFVIMQKYDVVDPRWQTLVHIDAYRTDTPEELSVIGLESLLEDGRNLIAIEWAEKAAALLPARTLHLRFQLSDGRREVHAT